MHAGFECGEVDWADFGQNVHTGGALILTSEAIQAIKLKSRMGICEGEQERSWAKTYKMTRSSTRVDFLEVPP